MRKRSALWLLPVLIMTACRGEDEVVVPPVEDKVPTTAGRNFYLLNEGNMGANKATLDFYDALKGTYTRNIFPATNPTVAFELGDVGNDLQVYGSRLYAVVNSSNLVEVMHAGTARHIGQVNVPNARYIIFSGRYAYVSSYAGRIGADPNARRGYVARIDTATLHVTDTCTVGYQPEEMAIIGNRLYVANSGGYRAPDYDRTISIVDLTTFKEVGTIDVAINLHRVKARGEQLFVNSRGDNKSIAPELYEVAPTAGVVKGTLGIAATNFCLSGDSLYALTGKTLVVYDLQRERIVRTQSLASLKVPYGLAVDDRTKNVYITDAKDYVSPGTLHCFRPDGTTAWTVTTGDIPAHFAFLDVAAAIGGSTTEPENQQAVTHVFDYRPAPGQFVNVLPVYTDGDTPATMNAKALASLKQKRIVTLGGFGGSITVGFGRTIANAPGEYDFTILGNAFEGNSSEAGIVEVALDANGNGLPDDEWYELAGSDYTRSTSGYEVTYVRPSADHVPVAGKEAWCTDSAYIAWHDHFGATGFLKKNVYHAQDYFPAWLGDTLTLSGTRLPDNAVLTAGTWQLIPFAWGYADNVSDESEGARFKIEWAVDKAGKPVALTGIDFVRIHTALHQQCNWVGETSTEFRGIVIK